MSKKRRDPVADALSSVLDGLPSAASRRAYTADWARYARWLSDQHVGVLAAETRDIAAHVAALRDAGLKKTTTGRALSVLREVYGALVRDRMIASNPARDIKNPRTDHAPKTPWIDEDAVRQLFAPPAETWRQKRDRLCLLLLLGLGWRRSEIARIRIEDFAGATVSGVVKSSKALTVGVPAWLADEIAAWRDHAGIDSGPLLPRIKGGTRPITDTGVYAIVRREARRAGFADGRVTPHGLRRTKITIEGERGVSLKARQLAVGHSSSATTERYDRARDAAAGAPGQVLADLVGKKTE